MATFKIALLGLAALAIIPFVQANESSPTDRSEARAFFEQVLKTTDNPIIASLAEENLERLNTTAKAVKPEEPKLQVEVPLLTRLNHTLSAPVVLNNTVMGTFVVDTGATYSVITPRMARKLKIEVTPDTPRTTIITANGPIHAPLVTVPKIALGPVQVENVQVIIHQFDREPILAGLLGMNFFKDMELTIKQDKLILGISQPS